MTTPEGGVPHYGPNSTPGSMFVSCGLFLEDIIAKMELGEYTAAMAKAMSLKESVDAAAQTFPRIIPKVANR